MMLQALALAALVALCIATGWWMHALVAALAVQRRYRQMMSLPGATEFDVKFRNWCRMARAAGWK